MPQTRAEKRWTEIIDRHNQSGQTIKAFAEANDLNARTLAWWRSRLKRARQEPARKEGVFVELAVAQPVSEEPVAVEPTVVLALEGYSAHVVIDHETDLELLRHVLVALC